MAKNSSAKVEKQLNKLQTELTKTIAMLQGSTSEINPQPLPPSPKPKINPQPLPPSPKPKAKKGKTLNPQPLPPIAADDRINPQPLPPKHKPK